MKTIIALSALVISSVSGFASITINLGAAELVQSDGTTPIPAGSLLQLVASTTDNVFTAPTAESFIGGSADDLVIASFGSNNSAGPGSFTGPITFNLSGNLSSGDQIMLRWYPTLTTASSAPGGTTPYGQFRTDSVENFSDIAWVIPADSATVSLNFLTQSDGGTQPDSAGTANLVTPAPIPEPSSVALAVVGGAALVGMLRRRARA